MSETRWLSEREQHAWRGFLTLHTQLSALLARRMQADSDLSMTDFAVLVALTDQPDGRVRYTELAQHLQWEKSRLSHQIARMVKRGLVQRQECPEDARGAFVALTPAGKEAIERAAPPHVDTVRAVFFDQLSDDQVDALAAIADQVLPRLAEGAAGR